jgi:hypothetical protein
MAWKCPICKTERAYKGVCYNCQTTRKLEYQDHLEKLEKKRKYRQGEVIPTIDELINCEFIYWNDKIYHRAFIQSLQLSLILRILNRKGFKYAIRKEIEYGTQ